MPVLDIPTEITAVDGAADVTADLKGWLNTVPQAGDTIRAAVEATYLVNQNLRVTLPASDTIELDWRGSRLHRDITDALYKDPDAEHPDGPDTAKISAHRLQINGGNAFVHDVLLTGTNDVPGRFVEHREFQSGIDLRGGDGIHLENITGENLWGDLVTFAVALDNSGPAKNVYAKNLKGTNIGRNGIAPVCVRGLTVDGLELDAVGYYFLDFEPQDWHYVRDAVVHNVRLSNCDKALGIVGVGGQGREIRDVDIYDFVMADYSGTSHAPIWITGGTPTSNITIGEQRGWKPGDAGRGGCTIRTLNAVVETEGCTSLTIVGNDSYYTGSANTDKIAVTRGGTNSDVLIAYNTFRGMDEVFRFGGSNTGDAYGNRYGSTAPFDQPIPGPADPQLTLSGARSSARSSKPLLRTSDQPLPVGGWNPTDVWDGTALWGAHTSDLTVRPARVEVRTSQPLLTQRSPLIVPGARSGSRSRQPLLTQRSALIVPGARSATRSNEPQLALPGDLIINGARSAARSSEPQLTQTTPLGVLGARSATRSSRPKLMLPAALTIPGARSAARSSEPQLTQAGALTIRSARVEVRSSRPLIEAVLPPADLTIPGARSEVRSSRPLVANNRRRAPADRTYDVPADCYA